MNAEQSKTAYVARRAPEILAVDAEDFEGILPPEVQRKRAEHMAAGEWRESRSYDHTAIVRRAGAPDRSGWSLEAHTSDAATEASDHAFGHVNSLPFSYEELLEIRDQINYIEAAHRVVAAARAELAVS